MAAQPIALISQWQKEFVAFRHDLHQHPETGFDVSRTSAKICKHLAQMGIEHYPGIGRTGVVAVIRGQSPASQRIGLRADMDALPVLESNTFRHASKYEGRMHACGHDGHTTMLLACAQYLQQTRRFSGTVYCVFQPAEEGGSGAIAMLEDGLLERFPMDRIFALHNWPTLPLGKVDVRPGPVMASCDRIAITIEGVGGHGAIPNLTIDPVLVAAHIITAAQSIVSRNLNPLDAGVVSLCAVEAGRQDAMNVIPRQARIVGTVRAFKVETQDLIEQRLRALVTQVASAFGAKATLEYERLDPPTINDAKEAAYAAKVAADLFGAENVVHDLEPSMGAEDFSYFLLRRPGAYLRIGQGSNQECHNRFLHNDGYDFNDELIPLGAGLLAALVEGG